MRATRAAEGPGGRGGPLERKSLFGFPSSPRAAPPAAARPHLRGLTSAILISDSQNSRRRGAAPGRAGATAPRGAPRAASPGARLPQRPRGPREGRGRRGWGWGWAAGHAARGPRVGAARTPAPPGPLLRSPRREVGVRADSHCLCARPAKSSPDKFQRPRGGGWAGAPRGGPRSPCPVPRAPRRWGCGPADTRRWNSGGKTGAPLRLLSFLFFFGEGMRTFPNDRVGSYKPLLPAK